MKTRSELILEFMVALASNDAFAFIDSEEIANDIFEHASALADKYLENL